MAEQQWEYCELGLGVLRKDKKKKAWVYDCYIRYYSPTGQAIHRKLATLDNALPCNPFAKAMGLLGGAGWELVSVQHGNKSTGGYLDEYALIGDNRVAYFKRPAIAGRAVDEPELTL
jgi:hypothetical protein